GTDVEDVGSLLDHEAGALTCAHRIEETPAVGKRIRRDVEDAHYERTAKSQQAHKRVASIAADACGLRNGLPGQAHEGAFAPGGGGVSSGTTAISAQDTSPSHGSIWITLQYCNSLS